MVRHAVEVGALGPAEVVVRLAWPLLRERVPAGAVPTLEQPGFVRRGVEPGRWDVAVGLAADGTVAPDPPQARVRATRGVPGHELLTFACPEAPHHPERATSTDRHHDRIQERRRGVREHYHQQDGAEEHA